MVVISTGACMRTIPEDSGITGLIWHGYDNIEGTGMLPSTLLGLITLVIGLEREYKGGGTTCGESSGKEPDLNLCRNPWINVTMEWSNHIITL
jgi:hypothetical protein